MASSPFYLDRVMESSTTTGTGAYTLAGALTGYQAWSVLGNGNSAYYCAIAVDGSGNPTGDWEVGLGTYTSAGTLLSRDSILASSNGGAAVSWPSGVRRIFLTHPGADIIPQSLLTTQGDIIQRGVSKAARLAIGTRGQMQRVNSGATALEYITRPMLVVFYNPSVTTTNIPAAVQEYGNNTLTRISMTLNGFTQCRAQVNVFTAAPAGGNLRIQYSTDGGTNWSDLTTNCSLTATGHINSTFQDVPAGAQTGSDVLLRIVTSGGNGTQSPVTVQVVLEFN